MSRLEERKLALLAQLSEVDAEIDDAKKEEGALKSAADSLKLDLRSLDNIEDRLNSNYYKFGDVSIKQATRLVLDAIRSGMNSRDLHAQVNNRYFEDMLPRTSFSPQLSRLKHDGEVEETENGWVLTDRGRTIMMDGKYLPLHK